MTNEPTFDQLAEEALRCGDPDDDGWVDAVIALRERGDEQTFRRVRGLCTSVHPLQRAFAADVLAQFGPAGKGRRPFAARGLAALRRMAATEDDPQALSAVVLGLHHHGDRAALPDLLLHARHRDPAVRRRVAFALGGLVPPGHETGIAALIRLMRDEDTGCRDWATRALAGTADDTPAVRAALAARLNDPDHDTAAEAARGLALRGDHRAAPVFARLAAEADPDGWACSLATEALTAGEGPAD